MSRRALLIATGNRGKLAEFRELAHDLPFDLVSPADVLSPPPIVAELGKTFEENARSKAEALAAATMMLTLADDSGLVVDVLDGAPGVHSARYAGERATDAENNAALLLALENARDVHGELSTGDAPGPWRAGEERRPSARFVCVLVLIDPLLPREAPGRSLVVTGTCEGAIAPTPRGAHGFGYDPLFLVEGTGRTMAELGEDEKNALSHRARAFRALVPRLAAIADATSREVTRVEA